MNTVCTYIWKGNGNSRTMAVELWQSSSIVPSRGQYSPVFLLSVGLSLPRPVTQFLLKGWGTEEEEERKGGPGSLPLLKTLTNVNFPWALSPLLPLAQPPRTCDFLFSLDSCSVVLSLLSTFRGSKKLLDTLRLSERNQLISPHQWLCLFLLMVGGSGN